MARLDKNSVLVSGVVATLQIVVSSGDYQEDRRDDKVYGMARELQQQLRHEIEEQVLNTLGEEFQVSYFDIRPGSAHIIVGIATAAFGIYMGFSRYKNFVESVGLLTSQIGGLVRRIFGQTPIDDNALNIRAIWSPGPSIVMAGQTLSANGGFDCNKIILFYLISSHAALLGAFIWLVLRHVK